MKQLSYCICFIVNIGVKGEKMKQLKRNGRKRKKGGVLKGVWSFVWLELEEVYMCKEKNRKFCWKREIEEEWIE